MADLYERNGVLLLDDNGTSLRGCCCPALCDSSIMFEIKYSFPEGIPEPTSQVYGQHCVAARYATFSQTVCSETWNGQWVNPSGSGTGASGCAWSIALNRGMVTCDPGYPGDFQDGSFSFNDNRRDPGATWSVPLVLQVGVYAPGWSARTLGVRVGGSVYRPSQRDVWEYTQIGSWNKTNSNTVSWSTTFNVVL